MASIRSSDRKHSPRRKSAVVIFAKPPVPGQVKTRLLAALTPQHAAALHFACLQDAVRMVQRVPSVARSLFVAGTAKQAVALAASLKLPRHWQVQTQRGADLGARLRDAFRRLLQDGYGKVIVIGTDTPWMGPRAIIRALRLLDRADVVLGPSEDGGYFLVGARRVIPEMFRGISWGSQRVFRQTLRALARRNIHPARLAMGFDLDRPGDLARLRRHLPRLKSSAPALAAAIAERNLNSRIRNSRFSTSKGCRAQKTPRRYKRKTNRRGRRRYRIQPPPSTVSPA